MKGYILWGMWKNYLGSLKNGAIVSDSTRRAKKNKIQITKEIRKAACTIELTI